MGMDKIDRELNAVKRLQEEMERRTQVEHEAERLICEGRFAAARELLATLDDSVVKALAEDAEAAGGEEERTCGDMQQGGDKRWMNAKMENSVSINLPEGCPNVCISCKREIAEMQIKKFGARPLYGFDGVKEDWLPLEIFITYGGSLAPSQRRPEI